MAVQLRNCVAETVSYDVPTPTLRVEKVDAPIKLKKLIADWYKIADNRLESIYSIEWRNRDKIALADTSKRVIKEIKNQLNKDLITTSVYAAYDERNRIQGIALANIQGKEPSLECLATHPQNIPLFDRETPRKGVGLALLAKVMSEVYKASHNDLGLYAEPTAVSFYEKYGFAIRADVPKKLTMPYLTITHDDMKKSNAWLSSKI